MKSLLASLLFMFIIFFKSSVFSHEKVVVLPMLSKVGGGKMANVITVAKSGADFSDPISAAESITDASADNPYLIMIGPGVYELDKTLELKNHIHATGSGVGVSLLKSIGASADLTQNSLIYVRDYSSLSHISVEHVGNSRYGVTGIKLGPGTNEMHDVAVKVRGQIVTGISSYMAGDSVYKDIKVHATGWGATVTGVSAHGENRSIWENIDIHIQSGNAIHYGMKITSSTTNLLNSRIFVGGGDTAYGVYINSLAPLNIQNTNIIVDQGRNSYGVYMKDSTGLVRLMNVSSTAGASDSYSSIYIDNSSPELYDVIATNVEYYSGPSPMSYGINCLSGSPVVSNSRVTGGTSSIYSGDGCILKVLRSSLKGGLTTESGINSCVLSDNGEDKELDTNCNETGL